MADLPGLATEATTYRVVVNDEEQYSIWPVDSSLPLGWHDEGTHGGKEECLDRIERIWVDMRPLSLRNRLGAVQN